MPDTRGGRVRIEQTDDGFPRIMMRPPGGPWSSLGGLLWLAFWAVAEVLAIRRLLSGAPIVNRAGFTQWVVLWTVGGILVLLVELWLAVGREYLILERDKLIHGRALLGIRMQRLYEVEAVGNLRVLRKSDLQIERYSEGLQVWGAGALAFDFRGRRVRVGDGLSEAEGGFVAGHVAQFYGWPRDAG